MSTEQIMIDEPASNTADKYVIATGFTVGSTLMLREQIHIGGSTASGLADVITTDPTSITPGLVVRDIHSTIVAARLAGTLTVKTDPSSVIQISNAPSITGITNSIAAHIISTGGTLQVKLDPSSVVQISNSPTVTANAGSGTFNVQLDPGHTLGSISSIGTTVTVKTDPSSVIQISNAPTITGITNTIGAHITGTSGTIITKLDRESVISGIQSTIRADVGKISDVVVVRQTTGGTFAVYFDPASPAVNASFSAASLEVVSSTGSRKAMDDAHAAQRVLIVGSQTNASLAVGGNVASATTDAGNPVKVGGKYNATLPTFADGERGDMQLTSRGNLRVTIMDGTTPFAIQGSGSDGLDNANSGQRVYANISGYNGATWDRVRTGPGVGSAALRVVFATDSVGSMSIISQATTITVKLDPAGTAFTNNGNTASIFTVSGSTSGGTTSGVTLISPSANYNFKIFAYSIMTTALSSGAFRFTNGAGTETELWRPLITPATTTSAPVGANMAVPPPSFIFATGTSTTLALKSDSGSLVHYSVSYIKESA